MSFGRRFVPFIFALAIAGCGTTYEVTYPEIPGRIIPERTDADGREWAHAPIPDGSGRKMVAYRDPEPHEWRDAVELSPSYLAVVEEVNEETSTSVINDFGMRLGSIHMFWYRKKKALMEQHGIEWWSPGDLNPGICYD